MPIEKDTCLISSLPVTLTSKILGRETNLRFRGICSVYISLNKKFCLPKNIHWLYFDDNKIDFNRVSEAKKMSKFVAPVDSTYLTFETTFTRNDNFMAVFCTVSIILEIDSCLIIFPLFIIPTSVHNS